MEIVRGTDCLQGKRANPVVAVGNFDGVHLGHKAVIQKAVRRAKEKKGESVIFTFDPHPLQVLHPEKLEGGLSSFSEKMAIFEQLGIDVVICEEFNQAFSKTDSFTFVKTYLHDRVGAEEIFVGEGFAFGQGRKGSTEDLKRIAGGLGIKVYIEPSVSFENLVVSSSRIRSLLKKGDVAQASLLLGRPYVLEGEVVTGAQRGRELGFSTANLIPDEKIIPKRGVYAVKVDWKDRLYEGVAYIGSQPTFKNTVVRVEVHLFDFHQSLYENKVRVIFIEYIRDEMKFKNAQALVKQITMDVQKAQKALRNGGHKVLTG